MTRGWYSWRSRTDVARRSMAPCSWTGTPCSKPNDGQERDALIECCAQHMTQRFPWQVAKQVAVLPAPGATWSAVTAYGGHFAAWPAAADLAMTVRCDQRR